MTQAGSESVIWPSMTLKCAIPYECKFESRGPAGDAGTIRDEENSMSDKKHHAPDDPNKPVEPSNPVPGPKPENSSSLYTIVLDAGLIGHVSPTISLEGGNLVIKIDVGHAAPGHHTVDQRVQTIGPGGRPQSTKLTLKFM